MARSHVAAAPHVGSGASKVYFEATLTPTLTLGLDSAASVEIVYRQCQWQCSAYSSLKFGTTHPDTLSLSL